MINKTSKTKHSESERLHIMSENERPFWERGIAVAGMDEVGRGPLAGPVVAACVILPPGLLIEGVNDSKKLSKKKLESLYSVIKGNAVAIGMGWVDEKIIDQINILNATKLVFKRAYENMAYPCSDVFIDAVKGLDIDANQHPIIHGDALCYSIAAASIVAKVERDRFMIAMAEKHPEYGFEKNVGYGTKQHLEALKAHGVCPIHRSSFLKKFFANND
ncbi:MAG: ribonuclease HII [Clostridia bacterium]|nr:ribonuclease HII [Clostridia bacterium]